MGRRIIEIIALLLGLVITIGVVIAIPLKSYNEYKDYLAEIEKQNEEIRQQAIKPVLQSITAELKEGVKFFANDMAEARAEHFVVTATYTKEGMEPWGEPVDEDDFTVSAPSDFYAKGGNVTIKYKGVSTTVAIVLEPVVLESIEVTVNPYTINYQAGSRFDASGMIVTAFYNDGSSKIIANDQYNVDEKVLAIGDTTATVRFTDGDVTKTCNVAIGVSEVLDNGAVTSIIIVDDAIVYAGESISTASLEVNAVYESGNRRPLTKDEYTIIADLVTVEFGKMYHLTVSYNADPTKTAVTDIKVRQTLQGEKGTIVGGSSKTEDEYAVINGVITKLENQVSFAGGFAEAVLKGNDAYLVLTLNSAAECIGDITVRCSNSYNVFFNGTNDTDGYIMKPLQINTILDLTVNGREVKVPANVILRGCGPYKEYAPLYGIYYEFTFSDIELDAGVNQIKFNFKKSTIGATTCWNESPSTLNVDCVHFDTLGSEIPDEYTITGIEIQNTLAPTYGQKYSDLNVSVIATIDNGDKIDIPENLCDIKVSGGKEGDTVFGFGIYTVTATLKADPSISASIDVEVPVFESFEVLHAGIEIVDGKLLYVFTGTCTGYAEDEIELFDSGTIYPTVIELGETTFRMYVDVTDAGYGYTYWPHIRLNGENYDNGINDKGDVCGRGLKFTNGQRIVLNGKIYTIVDQYDMPTLVIEKSVDIPVIPDNPTSYYDAAIDNSYISDKALIGKFTYNSDGTETNGSDKNNDYPGGIGNMDSLNKFVTYTFTLDEAGKVDFIWNIAGSKWNSSTESNDGILNAANNIAVIIDGSAVDFNGIALPAGKEGASIWWNVQRVVIKDVQLDAGTHKFTCLIITDGAGLNVGEMEIYSSSAGIHVHTGQVIPAVAADCENSGLTAGLKCSECGVIIIEQTVVPATGHAYDNDLDADCNNGCGFVRDVECHHTYTGPVLEDADGFYQKCDNNYCDSIQRVDTPVADSYDADIEADFSSIKQNTLNLTFGEYGAWGVETNGNYNDEEGSPNGAIGGLDKAGQYVYYEFVLDKPGRVDIIWSIAGSNWNASTQGNDGIADMAKHMTITIDGKPVDIGGLALPAGEGSLTWWNLQNLVIKDVALDAGLHTIRCNINAAGGINAGPMTIKSDKKADAKSADVTKIDLVVRENKIYYAMYAKLNGYTADNIRIWSDKDYYSFTAEDGENGETVLLIDVTNFAANEKINPHMSLAGKNYVNGENKNGDVLGYHISYEEKTVNHGSKYYQIITEWNMPSLMVVQAIAKATKADIFVDNNKVYYTLTFTVIGYDPADFEFFDNDTIYKYESISAQGNTVVFIFNITGNTGEIWPHLRINGVKWDGANGDVKVDTPTKIIEHNGITYVLREQYDMPTMVHS